MKACVFINLPAAEDRRQSVEASFTAAQASGQTAGWSLHRFEARGAADVASVPGAISPAEKACFASHRDALGQHLEGDEPVLIAEDDAVFAPQAFAVLDALLAQQPSLDVIYGDVVCDFNLMVHLASRRDAMAARGEYEAIDLEGRPYFAALAYVVRGSAKRRLHEALSAMAELNQPYDIALRSLCHGGQFRMAVAFPFLATVSSLADGSQIQTRGDGVFDATLNAFRRLMFAARDLEQCRADIGRLQATAEGDTAQLTGALFSVVASPAFSAEG
jgi:GR25 family glycosyltransferase involved in LPS biosynthesis